MMKKRLLYLSIAFLSAAILALVIVAMRLLYTNCCDSTFGIILSKVVFMGAYLVIVEININFMYQHSLRKRLHKRTTSFTLSLITLALVLLSLLARLFL